MNIFRVSRYGIKFSSTCWGKSKRGMSAPTLRSWWRGDSEHWGPGARIWPAPRAAVPPTHQLLLKTLTVFTVLSQCQTPNLLNSLSVIRVSYEFTVFLVLKCWLLESLCKRQTAQLCDICIRWSVLNRSWLSKHIYFGHRESIVYPVSALCLSLFL